MKIKILLKYGLIGALLIAVLAIALMQLHLSSDIVNKVVEIAGLIVFLVLGILLKRTETKQN